VQSCIICRLRIGFRKKASTKSISPPHLTSLYLTLRKHEIMVFKSLTNFKGQGTTPEQVLGMKDVQQSRRFESQEEEPETGRTDEDIAKAHKNPPVPTKASRTCDKKTDITKSIYNHGIRYSLRSDNDFTFPVD
jgi:hypothetical protein